MSGEGALVKDFTLPKDGEWNPDIPEAIDAFFEEIVNRHVAIKTGRYVGTGREQTVSVKNLPGPPKLIVIQTAAGGTPYVGLVAVSNGQVSSWNNKGFMVAASASAINTQGTAYVFLLLA